MRKQTAMLILVGLATAVLATAHEQVKRPISVVISPKTKSFASNAPISVQVAITNDTTVALSFESCPPPYIVRLTQAGHRTIEIGRRNPGDEYVCYKNIMTTIKPGDTWKEEITISDLTKFVPGLYDLEISWSFPVNTTKNPSGLAISDSLSVRSNVIEFSVQ